jgi:hypothetical protein
MSDAFTDHLPTDDPERAEIRRALWTRRIVMCLLAALPVIALIGLIGQRQSTSTAALPAATLRLTAPKTVRGGLFFQARVQVIARQDLKFPSLVLDDGWLDGMQLNSISPQPPNENALNGKVQLGYGELPANHQLHVWFEFEVNPTTVGRHSYGITLANGNRPVARIQRTIRVLP